MCIKKVEPSASVKGPSERTKRLETLGSGRNLRKPTPSLSSDGRGKSVPLIALQVPRPMRFQCSAHIHAPLGGARAWGWGRRDPTIRAVPHAQRRTPTPSGGGDCRFPPYRRRPRPDMHQSALGTGGRLPTRLSNLPSPTHAPRWGAECAPSPTHGRETGRLLAAPRPSLALNDPCKPERELLQNQDLRYANAKGTAGPPRQSTASNAGGTHIPMDYGKIIPPGRFDHPSPAPSRDAPSPSHHRVRHPQPCPPNRVRLLHGTRRRGRHAPESSNELMQFTTLRACRQVHRKSRRNSLTTGYELQR